MPMPSDFIARFAEGLELAGIPVQRGQLSANFNILSALPK